MSFSVAAFRSLVSAFKDKSYAFRPFGTAGEARSVYLRHDIDFSVELAATMAREEHELGVRATYFFMLTSNAYNLFSLANRTLVREIAALGHDIGLHFDAAIHEDVDAAFRREAGMLQLLTGRPLQIVSLHRPGAFLNDNNRKLPGVRHTYEDEFFRDMKYVSDSGGSFKYGHPLQADAFARGEPIHLLLHPVWWMTEPGSPSEKLRGWQARTLKFLNEETRANCLTFDGRSLVDA